MTATFLPPRMLSNGRFPFTKHLSAYIAGNCQAQGRYPSGTAFLYPTPCLHLLGGTVFITQSYNPLCGQRQCLVHLSAKGQASKIVRGVNERVTTRVPKRTLRTLETSALPGGALVGTQAREKVTPGGCSRRKARWSGGPAETRGGDRGVGTCAVVALRGGGRGGGGGLSWPINGRGYAGGAGRGAIGRRRGRCQRQGIPNLLRPGLHRLLFRILPLCPRGDRSPSW